MHEYIKSLLKNIKLLHFLHDIAVERKIQALYKINTTQTWMHSYIYSHLNPHMLRSLLTLPTQNKYHMDNPPSA